MSVTGAPGNAPALDPAGKYRLGPLLGVGGMGEVHRGWLLGESGVVRTVAIKRLLPHQSADPVFVDSFVHEARLSSLLHHACVVDLLDFGRDVDGRYFQVLEFVDGFDLGRLVRSEPDVTLPVPITVFLIGQILRALDYAFKLRHPDTGKQLGIVHRDCTPSNVLLSWTGDVKVTDFGVAKAIFATSNSRPGMLKGKVGYLSPEQLTDGEVDARADLFSVGVMAWELLCGRPLFPGDTSERVLAEVVRYARHMRRLEAPHVINPEVPATLSSVVASLLAVDREQRPADAAAALAALRRVGGPVAGPEELAELLARRFPERAPVHAAPASASPELATDTRRQMQAVTVTVPGTITAPVLEPPPRRRVLIVAVIVVALVALAGAIAVVARVLAAR